MSVTERIHMPDFATLREDAVTVLDEPAGKDLLRGIDVQVPEGRVVDSPQEAAAAARVIGCPCVVKIVAQDLPHKSDVGGVAGPLSSVADVEVAASGILASAPPTAYRILVEPWIQGITEVFLGLSIDPQYGPVVVFGAGGIWVEEYRDVAYRLAPVDGREALEMVRSRKATRLLDGRRGKPAVPLEPIASAVSRFSRLATNPSILSHVAEIEVNPLVIGADGTPTAVDCTVVLQGPAPLTTKPCRAPRTSRK